ncbi:GatB/YqeY domain-containing protein [Luteitalea sp.]|uniref:GatB/YqeY domain-containing protein n=1 Tax=Luteitalea sp. TaxID=2004800 RepID=UPI0025BDE468|nr:GatB/YqeY domain-containing protein [Luteitalea sp.]
MTDATLVARVNADLATALRAREQETLGTLRMLKSALTNKRVEVMRDLEDREALQVVTTLVKQRKDSATQFAAAGRSELAEKEQREAAILERYLPAALDASALAALIDQAVTESGATGPKDMGKVMKVLMPRLAGQVVDGKAVNDQVKARLGAA